MVHDGKGMGWDGRSFWAKGRGGHEERNLVTRNKSGGIGSGGCGGGEGSHGRDRQQLAE